MKRKQLRRVQVELNKLDKQRQSGLLPKQQLLDLINRDYSKLTREVRNARTY